MKHPVRWICHPNDGRDSRIIPVFKKEFNVRNGLLSAKLFITAHGIYEAEINGVPVTETRFNPGL